MVQVHGGAKVKRRRRGALKIPKQIRGDMKKMTKAYKLCPGKNQKSVSCGFCGGKGKIYPDLGFRKITCPVCDGEGEVIIVGDGTIVECNRCSGTGRIPNYVGSRRCQKCKGTGKVCS